MGDGLSKTPAARPAGLIDAPEACQRLGVKRATLYSYVSRGLVRRVTQDRRSLYVAADVDKLADRSRARSGHTASAVDALHFGPPVLETALTDIEGGGDPRRDGPGRIRLRGVSLAEILAPDSDWTFESTAAWMMGAPDEVEAWSDPGHPLPEPVDEPPLHTLRRTLAAWSWSMHRSQPAGRAPTALASPAAERAEARTLLRVLVRSLAPTSLRTQITALSTVGDALALALGAPEQGASVDRALRACVDHGLTTSTFAARLAASTGADLLACLTAAFAVFSGPGHGASGEICERLIDQVIEEGAEAVVSERLSAGRSLPGFNHGLYRGGDPRTATFLSMAREVAPESEAVIAIEALSQAALERGYPTPRMDLGLVVLRRALGLRRGSAEVIFGLGRIPGLVAHLQEQRASGQALRPTARYVEPDQGNDSSGSKPQSASKKPTA